MADVKIAALTGLSAFAADADVLAVVDVSDTTDSAAGTTKKATVGNVRGPYVAEDTITDERFRIADAVAQHRSAGHPGWLFFDDADAWETANSLTYPDNANEFHVFLSTGELRGELEANDDNVRFYIECGGSATGDHQAVYGLQRGNTSPWGWGIPDTSDDLHFTPDGLSDINPGTNAPSVIMYKDGDTEAPVVGKGWVCKSPDGSRWRLTVDNAGTVGATAL